MTGVLRSMATAVLAGIVVLTGCSATPTPGSQPESSPVATTKATDRPRPPTPSPSGHTTSGHTPSSTPRSSPAAGQVRPPLVTKVLVLVVENHSLDQMRAQMPYTFSVAQRYGYATAYHALTHPSLGNYLAIAGGSTFGVVDDRDPVAHQLHGPSVFSQALVAGRTATLYAEGMPGTCAQDSGGDQYVVRHNPWTYFIDDRAACAQYDLPVTRLSPDIDAQRLPNVGMVIPNLCNDAHDCSLATADEWMRTTVEELLAGPDWRSGRLAIVITADEDDHNADNQVLTVVLHPGLQHVVVDAPLTHLSLSRFLSEVLHQPPLREAADATSLGAAFGLRVGR
jgi:phosphatidylinositol-3-phosphatase